MSLCIRAKRGWKHRRADDDGAGIGKDGLEGQNDYGIQTERTKKDRSARYLLWGLINDLLCVFKSAIFLSTCCSPLGYCTVLCIEWTLHGLESVSG